jgi:hypothetical protein
MLVQAAIVARKEELAVEQQLLQAAVDAGVTSGIDPLDQPDIPADIKASKQHLIHLQTARWLQWTPVPDQYTTSCHVMSCQ